MKKGIIICVSLILTLGIFVCGYKVFNMSGEIARHRLAESKASSVVSEDDYEYIEDDEEEENSAISVRVLKANSVENFLDLTIKIDAKDTSVVSYILTKGKRFDTQRIISDIASYSYEDVDPYIGNENQQRLCFLMDSKRGEPPILETGFYTLRVCFLNGKCCDCSFELDGSAPEMLKVNVGKEINALEGGKVRINTIYLLKDRFLVDFTPSVVLDDKNKYDYMFFEDIKVTYASGMKIIGDIQAENVRIADDRFFNEYLYSPYNYDNYLNIQSFLINGLTVAPEDYHCEEVTIRDIGTPRIYGAQAEISMPERAVQVDNVELSDYGFTFNIILDEEKVRPTEAYIGKGNSFEVSEAFEGAVYSFVDVDAPLEETFAVEVYNGVFAPLGDYFVRVFYEDGSYGDTSLALYADPDSRLLSYADVKTFDGYGNEITVIRIDAVKDAVGITYYSDKDGYSIAENDSLSNVYVVLKNGDEIEVLDCFEYSVDDYNYRTDKFEIPYDLRGKYELKDFEAIKIGDVVIPFGA
ncbi:MAG: hypothetical protein IK121_04295 [Lachnospiraceae bacterium]|nr:hypothetical protein [Lachnospiraceae bacterium]